jgi:broad specificity phosphatase PhoE
MSTVAPLRLQWVRHGKVESHRGDVPLTAEGIRQAEAFGQRLRQELVPGEIVSFLYAPTRRARETATVIHNTVAAVLDDATRQQYRLLSPTEHWAIRNPDIYVAGTRIDLVSSAEALAEQLPPGSLRPMELWQLPFLRGFWSEPDRIGYWVNHPNPPGEDADTVARRLLTFARSFLDLPREQPRRYICVTHSTTMRAFLRRYLLGKDPGEPGYLESVDLSFAPDGSLTIHFREHSRDVVWQP